MHPKISEKLLNPHCQVDLVEEDDTVSFLTLRGIPTHAIHMFVWKLYLIYTPMAERTRMCFTIRYKPFSLTTCVLRRKVCNF